MPINFFRTICAPVIFATTVVSCETQKSAETTKVKADSNAVSTLATQNSSQSELLRTIIGVPTGDFRGYSFGDPITKIKSTESFEIFEDSTDHVGFTYETENFETIDILYFLDKNQAFNGLQIDVYLVNEGSTRRLWEQFDTYLSGKYTFQKREAKVAFWRHNSGKKVKLEDVSKGKDFGLRLSIGEKATSVTPPKIDV